MEGRANPAQSIWSLYTAKRFRQELLAAAHASCFNQALANVLGQNGLVATSIETLVTIDLGFQELGYPEIKSSTIKVVVKIEGCDEDVFQSSAMRLKMDVAFQEF